MRDGPLAPARAARLFVEVCSALDHAHGQGLIHRDLKPSNIMVTPDDHAKVLDLGLALMEGEIVDDPDTYRAETDEDECLDSLSFLLPRFPRLAELGVRPGYAGLYDMSPDDNPIIGPVPGIEGLFVICGSSGHGFKLGAGVGEEMARLVTEGRAELLEPFRPDRFAA